LDRPILNVESVVGGVPGMEKVILVALRDIIGNTELSTIPEGIWREGDPVHLLNTTYLAIARAFSAQVAEEVSRPAKRPRLESVVARIHQPSRRGAPVRCLTGCPAGVAQQAVSAVSGGAAAAVAADAARAAIRSGEDPAGLDFRHWFSNVKAHDG